MVHRPCKRPRQYLIAVAVGALAAGTATSLEVIATVSPGVLGIDLQIALLFALPIGAVAGALSLSSGILVRRLLRRKPSGSRVPAIGAGIGVLVVGLVLTVAVAAFIPPFAPFAWAPALASALGSIGMYLQSSVKANASS